MRKHETDEFSPPSHLSVASRKWFAEVCETYELESHHVRLLVLACESWDRAQQARRRIAADGGPVVTDRFGQLRTHPSVQIERDSSAAFARLVRELCLDDSTPNENRPPRKGR